MGDDAVNDNAYWDRDAADIAAEMVQESELFFRPFDLWLGEYNRYCTTFADAVKAAELVVHPSGNDEFICDYSIKQHLEKLRESCYVRLLNINNAMALAKEVCPLVPALVEKLADADTSMSQIVIRAELPLEDVSRGTVPEPCDSLANAVEWLKQRVKFESFLQPPAAPKVDNDTPAFSEDYRSGRWKHHRFTFSTAQAAVMEKLYFNWLQGTPEVSKDTLLDAAGSDASELRDLFRRHKAWKTLIIRGTRSGLWRIAPESP